MAYTKALFYPTIDIKNENWLKTAILFWDEINTIVPASINNPYKERATQYLFDEGILKPIHVNPEKDYIKDLTNDTISYLDTTEGFQLLTEGRGRSTTIHRDKLPRDISHLFDLHPEKLSSEIRSMVRHTITEDGLFRVDSNFAYFYMTLLANKICEHHAIAPLTDNSLTSNLSDLIRLNNQVAITRHDRLHYDHSFRREHYIDLAQGLLINTVIEGISISELTSLDDVIKFKRKYQDELGLFRTNIENLTKDIPTDATLIQIRQKVEDVYKNQFEPGYNALKKSLKDARIKWIPNFLKVSLVSTSATSIPIVLLGLSMPHALLSAGSISMISSVVSYNVDKRERLRNNPYSYLLTINKGI